MKSVLIVDDQMGIRLLLGEVFEQAGFSTNAAATGKEALQQLNEQQPDCILLDMKMPGMDGVEVLKEIRRQLPEVPVMMMTAYSEMELIEEAKELGIKRFFTKPFDIFEVRDTVVNSLQ